MSLIVGMLLASESKAQIETMYNMYRFNPQILNPVQAGSTEHSEVIFLHRNQWVGIEGAPKTYSLTGNIKWGQKKGIGLVGMVDEVGPMRATVLSGDFAYHTKLNEKWRLSGGIRLSAANVMLNFSQLRLTNSSDPLFQGDRSTGIQPNAGFGIRINKGDGAFISFAMPRLGKYNFGQYNGAFKDVNYMYLNAGTRVKLGGEITTKQGDVVSRVTLYPSVMARVAVDVPVSWDVNLQANLKGKLDVGVSYRREDSWGFRAGIQATKKYYLTYVFEKPISDLAKVTSQTHEFGVRMFIFKRDKKQETSEEKIGEIKEVNSEPVPVRSEQGSQKASEPVSEKASEQSKSDQLKTVTPMVNTESSVVPVASAPTASSAQSAVQTPSEEDEYEYVTVTKTRVVRKRPKVAKKVVTSTATAVNNGTKTVVSPVTKKVTTTNKATSSVKTSVTKSKPVSKKASEPVQSAPSAPSAVPTDAPKISRQRVNNNETVTTVERKGGDASQVGNDGKTKITKRKRKDGTEETVYTTTEVVKKRKLGI
ncbi:PorP/SprF family type IX secretion system membrane protein [Sandaracinomonas limnophila]|nr:type IX secretion system membrane protein PorP/SprF [Sandaracinomonas limnophila]